MSAEQAATPRYHGFTCPECGHHEFGTYTWPAAMGTLFPAGTSVGSCHSHQHHGTGCKFKWNRDDPDAESKAMYEQTPEEWAQGREAFLTGLRSQANARLRQT